MGITSMTLVPAFAAGAQRKQVTITFDAKKHKETISAYGYQPKPPTSAIPSAAERAAQAPRTAGANGADPVPKY